MCKTLTSLPSVSISVLCSSFMCCKFLIPHRLPFQVFMASHMLVRSCQWEVLGLLPQQHESMMPTSSGNFSAHGASVPWFQPLSSGTPLGYTSTCKQRPIDSTNSYRAAPHHQLQCQLHRAKLHFQTAAKHASSQLSKHLLPGTHPCSPN